MAIEALKSKYVAKTGSGSKVIVGDGAPPAAAGYESKAQMTSDMKDPRYAKDPAYRRAVERKIAKTTAF
jgi:predicted AlkP superfamily phosphohydrolase/phosphomutase